MKCGVHFRDVAGVVGPEAHGATEVAVLVAVDVVFEVCEFVRFRVVLVAVQCEVLESVLCG